MINNNFHYNDLLLESDAVFVSIVLMNGRTSLFSEMQPWMNIQMFSMLG